MSFIFHIIGLKHTAPAVASIVAMVEPVTASLFGVVILNQTLVGPQILGMGLILVTVTALSVYSSAQNGPLTTKPRAEQRLGLESSCSFTVTDKIEQHDTRL